VLEAYQPSFGGLESWTAAIAKFLCQRGHQVTIVACSGQDAPDGISVHYVGHAPSFVERAKLISQYLAHSKFDIVHDTGSAFACDVFQPQTGSRLVNSHLDRAALPWRPRLKALLSPKARRWRRDIAALEVVQFKCPDRIIAVSRMVRRQMATRFSIAESRITVIYNGIETAQFEASALVPHRQWARQKFGFGDATIFLLVANNFRLKGVAVAIRAMARLATLLPNAKLAVVGSADPTSYRHQAHLLGVADRVIFVGYCANMAEIYAAADFAIQPSHYDACSLSTLEGLASGLPTITTATNGAGELITPGREGFVLPHSNDAAALAAAMLRVVRECDRANMAIAARELARLHDVARNHQRVEDFYWHRLELMD
jgi:UDP-glucose:(heptosyl)LPS alpha-1,3-glucosyltransferase